MWYLDDKQFGKGIFMDQSNRISEALNPANPFLTVIVPVYNEEMAIASTIAEIGDSLGKSGLNYEILVVNDCSQDGTRIVLENLNCPWVRCIHHGRNRGYGAALKTGVLNSNGTIIVITDADGTYPNHRIPELVKRLGNIDMLVGARTGKKVRIPLIRRPAKWLIGCLASYLARYKIPDVNSGLRVFRREALLPYLHLLPDGFSFTTTITLVMLTCGNEVVYEPIDYAPRVGKSKIRPIRDTLNFIQLIVRTVLLFEPLRIFIPLSVLVFLAGVFVGVYSFFFTTKFMDMTTAVLMVGSLQLMSIGMLADMINRRLGHRIGLRGEKERNLLNEDREKKQ